jgi:hypothetical protein
MAEFQVNNPPFELLLLAKILQISVGDGGVYYLVSEGAAFLVTMLNGVILVGILVDG